MSLIIIPTYNEGQRIEKSLLTVLSRLKNSKGEHKIIIADDNSTDNTISIAEKTVREFSKNKSISFNIMRSHIRLGKGGTVSNVVKELKDEIVVFIDADLPHNVSDVPRMVKEIENGYDIVVGSRYSIGSQAERHFLRHLMSIAYNNFLKLFFGSRINDHQCGFKAFKRKKILSLLSAVRDSKWFWDTELLIKAQKRGLKIKEIPIKWVETQEGTIGLPNFMNMAHGLFNLFLDIYLFNKF